MEEGAFCGAAPTRWGRAGRGSSDSSLFLHSRHTSCRRSCPAYCRSGKGRRSGGRCWSEEGRALGGDERRDHSRRKSGGGKARRFAPQLGCYSHQSAIQFVTRRASASNATIAMMLMTVAPMPPIMAGRIYVRMAWDQFITCHWRPAALDMGAGGRPLAWRRVHSTEGVSIAKLCSQRTGNMASA